MADKRFDVLVSRDEGLTWTRFAGIIGNSADAAITRVREADDELKADNDALYHAAGAPFRARKMTRQMVEKWGLEPFDLSLTDGARPAAAEAGTDA